MTAEIKNQKSEEIKEEWRFLCIRTKRVKKDDDCSETEVTFAEGRIYVVKKDSLGFYIYDPDAGYKIYLPKDKDDDEAWAKIYKCFTLFEPAL
jgi:hypothetical protein